MPKVALFLGAGASRAFDYPTTEEFVVNLIDVLSQEEKNILQSIIRSPEVLDIEHVLQTLDPILEFDSNQYIQSLFKQSNVRVLKVNWNDFIRWCKALKETIISELHTQYEFDRTKLGKVVEDYTQLSLILADFSRSTELDIFTTNYDSLIEKFCEESDRGYGLTCGFKTDHRSRREFWDAETLREWKLRKSIESGTQGTFRLYKLHGSLDWRETADDRIERVRTEEEVSKKTKRWKRNILIYPAQKNYTTEDPFRRLMKYFEEVLNQHDLCLVIGFSFRDPFINNTFLDFLRQNRKRRLVVVSPSASQNVEKNLIGEAKRLRKRIVCLDKPFGEQETFADIMDALEPKPKKAEEEEEL